MVRKVDTEAVVSVISSASKNQLLPNCQLPTLVNRWQWLDKVVMIIYHCICMLRYVVEDQGPCFMEFHGKRVYSIYAAMLPRDVTNK